MSSLFGNVKLIVNEEVSLSFLVAVIILAVVYSTILPVAGDLTIFVIVTSRGDVHSSISSNLDVNPLTFGSEKSSKLVSFDVDDDFGRVVSLKWLVDTPNCRKESLVSFGFSLRPHITKKVRSMYTATKKAVSINSKISIDRAS